MNIIAYIRLTAKEMGKNIPEAAELSVPTM